jgi:hypothetical protein
LAPVRLTALMVKAAVPVLVTVMTWAVLATPTAWVPKAMLVVLSDSAGAPLTPVPVSGTAVGLLLALLTMLTLADLAPAPAGPNVTEIVQVPLGAMAEPQVLVVEKEGTLAPPRLTELMFSAEPPVLVTVIRCAGLEVPVAWLPKATLLGFSDTIGGGATPVPVIGTEAGLPVALLTMLTLADLAPIDGGVNVTMIVQVPLGAMAVLQLLLLEKEGTLAPSRLTELTLSVEVPVLVTVIEWALLEVPSTWLPNGMPVGLSDNVGGAMPVPVRVTTLGLVGALLTMLTLADLAPALPGVKVTNIVH